jgi:hypothetical protein
VRIEIRSRRSSATPAPNTPPRKDRLDAFAPGALIALEQAFGGADAGFGDLVEIIEEQRFVFAMGVEALARFQARAGDGERLLGDLLQGACCGTGFSARCFAAPRRRASRSSAVQSLTRSQAASRAL